jgi:Carboxypeptidase regulatory-like domain
MRKNFPPVFRGSSNMAFAVWCCGLWVAAAVSAVSFPIEVSLPTGRASVGAHLIITMTDSEGRFITDSGPFRAPDTLDMKFAPGKTITMHVEADGYWSAPQLFITKTTDRPIQFVLRPTGKIQGRLTAEGETALPGELGVRFESPPEEGQAQEIPRSRVSCPVTEGRLLCEVPAGVLDLRLKAEEFIPRYLWGTSIADGQVLDLGNLVLKRGGSVAGRVAIDGQAESSKARVELQPMQASYGASTRDRDRFKQLALAGDTNEHGFFQLGDVPPGQYWLSAKQGGVGESFRFPVKVFKDSETTIETPLVLRKPTSLGVSVSPPLDYLGNPWSFDLYEERFDELSFEPIAQGAFSEEGIWRKDGLRAGTYQLAVFDSRASRWAMETLEIDSVNGERHDEQIQIDLLPVEGRVLYGDEPLVAKLWFGGAFGTKSIEMATDEEGHFSGLLPEYGEWRVEVSSEEPTLRHRARLVEVEKRDGKTAAEVEIVFSTQLVEGEVVGAEGEPVSNAAVFLTSATALPGAPPQERTGDEGRFSFAGIEAGAYTLQAYRGGADGLQPSNREEVEISKKAGSPFVKLQFGGRKILKGRVLSPNGRVPGASVACEPASPSGTVNSMIIPHAQTDVDGNFSLQLHEDTAEVTLTVMPPGFSLTALKLPIEDDAEVAIPVYDAGGSLVLEDDGGLEITKLAEEFAVEQNGVALNRIELQRWARYYGGEEPGEIRISRLAFGDYRVCRVSSAQSPCVSGFLPPHGELRLDVAVAASDE